MKPAMNHTLIRLCAALLLIGLGLFWHKPAEAQITCSNVSMTALSFGTVDPQSSQTDATATFSYRCRNNSRGKHSATICFSIGEPAGGPTNPRQMHDGGNTLDFQLYQDPARSVVWGSQFFGYFRTPLMIDITLQGGDSTGTRTATLYGRVLNNQTTAVPGSYNDNYQTGDTAVTVNDSNGANAPGSCDGTSTGSNFPFDVSAIVANKCTVSAATLDFGTPAGLLTTAVPATSSISVQCAVGTAYSVGLDGGLNSGNNINARKMVLGANSVAYQLYRDSAQTQVWGYTVNTDTVQGIGTGNPQNLTVYGQVPAQTTPPAGTYLDSVVVSVTY